MKKKVIKLEKFENEIKEEKMDLEEEEFWLFGEKLQRIQEALNERLSKKVELNAAEIEAERCESLNNIDNYLLVDSKVNETCFKKCLTEEGEIRQTSCGKKDGTSNHGRSKKVKSFPCNTCGLCFNYKYQLENHSASFHEKDKPFKCPECEYSCCLKQHLTYHIRAVHKKEKPFKCTECDYSCSVKGSLIIHISSIHKKEKPFKCTECDYSCSRKGTLLTHIRSVHRKEKPFKCTECDYSCSRKGSLISHISSVHKKEKPFKCPECDNSFSQKGSLIRHVLVMCVEGKSHFT